MSNNGLSSSGLAKLALASAHETAEADEPYANLPRLLRYALAEDGRRPMLHERLFREILQAAPALQKMAQAWLDFPMNYTVALAVELEARSVQGDRPDFVALANCVRFLGLTDSYDLTEEHRKVAAALAVTAAAARRKMDPDLRAQLDGIILGWALLASGIEESAIGPAREAARYAARDRLDRIVGAAVNAERRAREQAVEELEKAAQNDAHNDDKQDNCDNEPGFVRVCDLSDQDAKSKKIADLVAPFKRVIGVGVPLAPTPDLAFVRAKLVFEFPYATRIVDAVLEDLVGREYVKLRPTLLFGAPGGGKSRFVRRVAELLGAGSWRIDGSASDGGMIGGTGRRWSTAEPCHPLLAILRAGVANPVILIDEVEKAATRTDYGRLWDSLLQLLEGETASRYPDPALQTTLNLAHVSYLATANAVEPLPQPLRDRFRILAFPTPTSEDIHALLPPLAEAYADERGQDVRWFAPFSGEEIEAVAASWKGGSVRRLQRLVEGILRARDKSAARH